MNRCWNNNFQAVSNEFWQRLGGFITVQIVSTLSRQFQCYTDGFQIVRIYCCLDFYKIYQKNLQCQDFKARVTHYAQLVCSHVLVYFFLADATMSSFVGMLFHFDVFFSELFVNWRAFGNLRFNGYPIHTLLKLPPTMHQCPNAKLIWGKTCSRKLKTRSSDMDIAWAPNRGWHISKTNSCLVSPVPRFVGWIFFEIARVKKQQGGISPDSVDALMPGY